MVYEDKNRKYNTYNKIYFSCKNYEKEKHFSARFKITNKFYTPQVWGEFIQQLRHMKTLNAASLCLVLAQGILSIPVPEDLSGLDAL